MQQRQDTRKHLAIVAGEGENGVGSGAQEQAVNGPPMRTRHRLQFGRQGEDEVKTAHRQQFLQATRKPAVLGRAVALGTVSVAAGMVEAVLIPAPVALLTVPAHRRRAAIDQGTQRLVLYLAQLDTVSLYKRRSWVRCK